MSRILLLGMSPLPTENETRTLGPGKRTWQFTKPLLDHGHRICLITARHAAAYQDDGLPPIVAEELGNLVHYSVEQTVFERRTWLQSIHDHFRPRAIVGATVYPSAMACRLMTDRPIWADLFGHTMAEAQSKCLVFADDYYLFHFWSFEQAVLDRADLLSVVSTPQGYATTGELGTRGRMNRRSAGYEFIRLVPCAVDVQELGPSEEQRTRLRGRLFGDDDFIILWSGGYNTWSDIDTLFEALERVMAVEPRVRFVSTGGQIDGHDEITYPRFLRRIAGSPWRDRFLMQDWLPLEDVPAYWAESDLAINVDRSVYESRLGSRNRILDWMASGLPIVTSRLCELSQIIEHEGLGQTFEAGDVEGLQRVLLEAVRNPDRLQRWADRARSYALEHFSYEATTQPLVEWLEDPRRAPDADQRIPLELASRPAGAGRLRRFRSSLRDRLRATGPWGTARWILAKRSRDQRSRS